MIARATNPARYPLTVRRLPALALLLTCAAIGLPATGATGATEHSCGAAGTGFDAPQGVYAGGVSCVSARRLARRHSRMNGRNDGCDLAKASCRLDGYVCRRTFFGNSGTRVRCTKAAKRVRFFYGT
ncbi:MAG: hypothetical protein QOI64_2834 [Solirubrobacteraceae bacterium]|nr:hypothetical protein [Solirubrobacteraceae bacterium]